MFSKLIVVWVGLVTFIFSPCKSASNWTETAADDVEEDGVSGGDSPDLRSYSDPPRSCAEIICEHGGRCIEGIAGPVCLCSSRYEGDFCQFKIMPGCHPPCDSRSKCISVGDDSYCEKILVDPTAPTCTGFGCVVVDPLEIWPQIERDPTEPSCIGYVCQNDGVCTLRVRLGPICVCPPTHKGQFCQTSTTPTGCRPPCDSRSKCIFGAELNDFYCYDETSPPVTTTCTGYNCQNGGICRERKRFGPICVCPRTHKGQFCETTTMTGCEPPCDSRSKCIFGAELNDFYCYKETSPSLPVTPVTTTCTGYNCQNGGVCRERKRLGPICVCPQTHTGQFCQTSTTPTGCHPPCVSGSKCVWGAAYDDYYCYKETSPSLPVTPVKTTCTGYFCQNGGICREGPICLCPQTHKGQFCQTITPTGCEPPCASGSTCMSIGDDFSCVGTTAPPVPTTACSSHPCNNDCTCVESCRHSKGYYCESDSGYLGKNCDIQPPNLHCGSSSITISVLESFVAEYGRSDSSALVVSETPDGPIDNFGCRLMKSGGAYRITLDPTECDIRTTFGMNGEKVCEGIVWMRREILPIMDVAVPKFDVPVPVVKFRCKYNRELLAVSSFIPATILPPVLTSETSQQGTMELCKIGTACPGTCPVKYAITGGATYTIGETIHLRIQAVTSTAVKVAIQELYLSCGKGLRRDVQLVTDGCPFEPTLSTTVGHNGLSKAVCVSFRVPQLTYCSTVYIHAKLADCKGTMLPCPGRTSSLQCASKYQSLGRTKRSVITENVLGPIYILDSYGNGTTVLFPGKHIVPVDGFISEDDFSVSVPEESTWMTNPWLIVFSICCFCFSLFIVVFVMKMRYNNSHSK